MKRQMAALPVCHRITMNLFARVTEAGLQMNEPKPIDSLHQSTEGGSYSYLLCNNVKRSVAACLCLFFAVPVRVRTSNRCRSGYEAICQPVISHMSIELDVHFPFLTNSVVLVSTPNWMICSSLFCTVFSSLMLRMEKIKQALCVVRFPFA